MRLFIAIPLSSEIKAHRGDFQETLKTSGITGSWSPIGNLHLTLAFIGEYADPDKVLDTVGSVSFMPFDLCFCSTGSFSDTLWAGVGKNESLEKLAGDVRKALAGSGIPFDRKTFNPHITLVRKAVLKNGLPDSLLKDSGLSTTDADTVSLFKSTQGKNGMIYTEMGHISG